MTRLALLVVAVALPAVAVAQDSDRGRTLYARWCAGCHGDEGAGDGEAAAYMLPRPRDFRGAVFQIRSTASGGLPTDDDMRRVIDEGMPGTAMPGWRSRLGPEDRDAVIAHLKTFSQFFDGEAPVALQFGRAPRGGTDAVAEGRQVFDQLECFKCHGTAGRGDGSSAPTLTDDWEHPIRAADLTRSWRFNGGGTVEQIFARLRTGLDGTPMPSFSDAVDAGIITEEQLWRVAQYVHSLSGAGEPAVREVLRAGRTAGPLPSGPDDPAWDAVPAFYVPLVGQVVVTPRWFAPTVDAVWVQAIHDDAQLAMRLTWHDPSRSPDPVWDEWLGRAAATMTDVDGPVTLVQGPDRFHIQLPQVADGSETPYFLGGNARTPVALWAWNSAGDAMTEGRARGLGTLVANDGAPEVHHASSWQDGAWRLQLTRSLVPADSTRGPRFTPGASVPIAFYAADGSNGEDAIRGSVSAWYAIYLDVPTSSTVYVAPLIAALLTAGFGVVVVRRAQREHRRAD